MKQRPKYLLDYRKDQFSQNGEDGVIEFILSKLPDKNGWCVEFGAWDGKYLSNTYNLIANHKYRAVLIEGDAEKYETLKQNMKGFTGCVCKNIHVAIDGRNKLDDILKETPLPKHFDLLSIDVDGDDYHVWNSLREYEPSVVLIELNGRDKPGVERINQTGSPLVWGVTGTSITSMTNLAETKGYSLICHVGTNAIYVRSEYLPMFHERKITPLEVFTYEFHSLRELTLREIVTLDRTEVIRRLNEGYKQIDGFGQNHFGNAWNLLHKVLRRGKRIVRYFARFRGTDVHMVEFWVSKHNMGTTLSDLTEGYPGQSFTPSLVCPVCAGSSRILHSASNIHPDKPYAFNFRVCSTCGHGWIDPMPTQGLLNYLYGRGSRSVIGEWGPNQLTIPEQVCVRREMKRPPARYFELGVGHGHLYRLFVERGWKCTGVDPGDWAGRFPNVYRDLSDVDPALSADLLVAFDVLEHVSDPVSILRNLWKLAAPKAKLYCAMPNRESLRARRDRQNWRMVRPLGHVNYYSKKSITRALKLAGFAVRYVRATDLIDLRFPRRRQDIKPALIEMLGLGDQWIVIAERC